MGIKFEAIVECDRCGIEEDINDVHYYSLRGEATVKVGIGDLPNGWEYDGEYLCQECAEEDEDDGLEPCIGCGAAVDPSDMYECDTCGEEYCASCGHECEEEDDTEIFDDEED